MADMTKYATIDVGSNSVLLHVAECKPGGCTKLRAIEDRAVVTRLGEGLKDTRRLSRQAMNRTLKTVCEFKHFADQQGAEQIAAVGTMAMRTAGNAEQFVDMVQSGCGVNIEIISGDEEARLSYLAVKSTLPTDGKTVVVDVGGGSTEFIHGSGKTIERRNSIEVGALHLTERHLKHDPVLPEELRSMRQELKSAFGQIKPEAPDTTLLGIGGTITTICAVKLQMSKYDPERIEASRLSRTDIEIQLERYARADIAQRGELPGLDPKRAGIILAGAAIVAAVLDSLKLPGLRVSARGLRHGLMLDRFAAVRYPHKL